MRNVSDPCAGKCMVDDELMMLSCAMQCRLHAELHKESTHYHVAQRRHGTEEAAGLSAGASNLNLVEASMR